MSRTQGARGPDIALVLLGDEARRWQSVSAVAPADVDAVRDRIADRRRALDARKDGARLALLSSIANVESELDRVERLCDVAAGVKSTVPTSVNAPPYRGAR